MSSPKMIFLAAAEADKAWKSELLKHFAPLEASGKLQVWHEEKASIGRDWSLERQTILQKSSLVLLLLSADFIASDFFSSPELQVAYQAHKSGRLKIIPILLRPCNWAFTPYASLSLFSNKGAAIVNGSSSEIDQALSAIVKEVIHSLNTTNVEQASFSNTFNDVRNGKIYKTIELQGKTWLAENLNYSVPGKSWYYENDAQHGLEHGCLYTWEGAIEACPPGWHLPSVEEWDTLINYFGGAYLSLKNLLDKGDAGLNIQLSGKRNERALFVLMQADGFYWTGKEQNFSQAYYYMFDTGMHSVRCIPVNKKLAASCRVIKD